MTLVDFFDYNCLYYQRAAPVIHGVIGEDSNLRVVHREGPILSEDSVYATRAAK